MGGGAGGICFSGGTEGDQSSPKGCLGGGGRLYQTDCKLTVNKGGNRKSITEPSGGIR